MTSKTFDRIVIKQLDTCMNTLTKKSDEYATEDRLHNFKVAAEIQNCTPIKALGGMMCKHTVSVYDLINDHEAGKDIPMDLWREKIGDSINYLLLLKALIVEDKELATGGITQNE